MFSFLMCFETRLFDIGPEVCDCRSKLKVPINPEMRWSGSSFQKLTAQFAGEFFCSSKWLRVFAHTHTGTDYRDLLSMIVQFVSAYHSPFFLWISIFFGPSIFLFSLSSYFCVRNRCFIFTRVMRTMERCC